VKRRCVFMDRDGVINVAPPPGEYLRSWREFRFIPGVADWIRLFNALDLLVVVVTNQQGVAKGLTRLEDLEEIHRNMVVELRQLGALIDDVYCCPHQDNTCDCRKPRPGMVRTATAKWDIDLGNSLMIGDSETDRQFAANCGLRFVHVQNGMIQGITD
jgi:D-glycero-D-manno-heptose 1,7-bisphosphate phosphatase